ncbi:GTP cyclohydrolase II [Intrasporangium sp. YIM S08009]|uniref:GTP cyclohydrolase II n=1 Tax=Intrasporangium zincisolvens TaxID=3080018 RepID=UPI002B05F46A|nr:GTP cyclohydrolase II [Intrasporangium sp. YIM S08009]
MTQPMTRSHRHAGAAPTGAVTPIRPAASAPPPASVRAAVRVPIALADGFETTALAHSFTGLVDGLEHIALGLGDRADPARASRRRAHGPEAPPLVRLHSECLTGDVFGSQRCDCGPQLHEAVRRLTATGGYLLYLRQEGRGIGLYPKLDAYVLQDSGLDTYQANVALGFGPDERDYTVAAQMLLALDLPRVQVLTNNPDKPAQLERLGIEVTRQVPTGVHVSPANAQYLSTKATRGAHTLELPPA